MKKEYIKPLISVYVCNELELLTTSSVTSDIGIEWGETDIDGQYEADAPEFSF